ncbi:hypothetical protein FQN54_009279 [Arachnomyces sp. PD_36]|nr:hypothetical protein FQN54_009279 [Arachnomyces sp. PD_36]
MVTALPAPDDSRPEAEDRDIEVLSCEYGVPELDGQYRLRIGKVVKYLTIQSGVYTDEDTMCFPRLFVRSLPKLPDDPWTSLEISRDGSGKLHLQTSNEPLPSAEPWHSNLVDVLSLPKIKTISSKIYETLYQGQPAIAKIARFPWEMPLLRMETVVYNDLTVLGEEDGNLPAIMPPFLGHLVENGRVMGMLLGKIEGTYAGIKDLSICRNIVRRLHDMEIIHGDVNRYNFIVSENGERVVLLDFENAEQFSEERAREEIECLERELKEESGRGKKSLAYT